MGPVAGVDIVEVEGVVDVEFRSADAAVKHKPVLLEEAEMGALAARGHFSPLLQPSPLQRLHAES